MKLQIKMFAVARQLAGSDQVEIDLAEPATIADVRAALVIAHPTLGTVSRHLLFAVNTEYAGESTPVSEKSEVACIPPVSGG